MLLLALLGAGACATPAPTLAPLAADDPRPRALLDAWEQAARSRRALRGHARLAVDGGDGAVRLRGRQVLVLERPARLRVEILGFLDQTVAVLVTDGERFELFRAGDRSYETGEVHPGLLWEQAWLALTPQEAVDLLLGVPAPQPGLAPSRALGDERGGVRFDLADAQGRVRRRAEFDGEGRLRRLEVLDASGGLAWTARFDEYATVSGEAFAHAVSLDVTAGGTRAEIALRDVELNPELPPGVFQLRAREAAPGGGSGG
jgi:hypothetical protein